jgi:hypothetical protein
LAVAAEAVLMPVQYKEAEVLVDMSIQQAVIFHQELTL